MSYQYIMFDLDGTLTNPFIGITSSVAYALESFGIHEDDLNKLTCFIGPPLRESFSTYYGFNQQDTLRAVEKYRERYTKIGLYENEVVEGAVELLKTLRDAGKTIILATSKPLILAEKILKHYDLYKYFDYVDGADMNFQREEKWEVMQHALDENNIHNLAKVVMIGDRKHDIIGSQKVGVDCIGVMVGFGSYEELYEYGANYIVEKLLDVLSIVM